MSGTEGERATREEKGELSFEQSLSKLENIVRTLEVGEVKLEEALKLFEEGSALSRRCLEALDKIEKRLEVLHVVDGKVVRMPLEDAAPAGAARQEPGPELSDDEE